MRHGIPIFPVVNYHHVHDLPEGYFSVTPAKLKEQLEFMLNAGYVPISLERAIELKGQAKVADKHVLVTFDDAYENFLEHAWPVLKALKIPVTLFVIVNHIGGTNEWDDIRRATFRHLGVGQLKFLRDEGVELGCHTLSHRPLALTGDDELKEELATARIRMEETFDTPVRTVAYPGGYVDSRIRNAAAEYFDLGFATSHDKWAVSGDEYRIPRFDPCFCGDLNNLAAELETYSTSVTPS